MRWFINSTKETAGFNDNNNFQAQIDVIKQDILEIGTVTKLVQKDWKEGRDFFTLKDHFDGFLKQDTIRRKQDNDYKIRISNSLNEYEKKIVELENGMEKFKGLLRAAFNTITDLDNKVKALENQSMPKQSISEVKAKELEEKCIKIRKPRNRMKNTFSDPKFMTAYAIAHGYSKAGFNQVQIAGKLNSLGWKTPRGMEFGERHVSDLMCNSFQKARFMEGKEKKAKL